MTRKLGKSRVVRGLVLSGVGVFGLALAGCFSSGPRPDGGQEKAADAAVAVPNAVPGDVHDHDHDHAEGDVKDHADDDDHAHEGHTHGANEPHGAQADHDGHDDGSSVSLSPQAQKNLGLTTARATIKPFVRYVEVPAVVSEWPGRTHLMITSPLTGVINGIHVSRGEAVAAGELLFRLRLTHQDLVETQGDFLTALGELDVEQREIARLDAVAASGAVAGKTRLAREYERNKLQVRLRAARQSLLLHGLAEAEIERIERTRELVREVEVRGPAMHVDRSLHHRALSEPAVRQTRGDLELQPAEWGPEDETHPAHLETPLLVTQLAVNAGESVEAGQLLATLSDYRTLLIEGSAFQRDTDALRRAANDKLSLQAVVSLGHGAEQVLHGLRIAYLGNEVERESRAMPFYVALENEQEVRSQAAGRQFVSWKYKPGQRMTLRIPVESYARGIVVPSEAVVSEGAERFVFTATSGHFHRKAVHVLSRTGTEVAIADDGSLKVGTTIVVHGAHQLQMTMENQHGGAIDPHAGHQH